MGNIIKNINLFESVDIDPLESIYFKKYDALVMVFVKEVDVTKYERMAFAIKKIFNFDTGFDINVRGYRTNCREGERFVYVIQKSYSGKLSYGWDHLSDFRGNYTENYPKLFTIDEVDSYQKILTILKYGNPMPTYNPRKIERTLESSNNKYYYRFKTEKEFEQEYGPNWRDKPGLWWAPDNMMDYLLGTRLEADFPDSVEEITIPNRNPDADTSCWSIQRPMLVKSLSVPDYSPKKITRVLESVVRPRYRIKTEKEFINDFGDNWRKVVALGWVDPMDFFYGKDIDITIKDEDKYEGNEKGLISMGGWNFSWDMIEDNKPKVPNYNPRKTERTLEAFENKWKYNYLTIRVDSEEEAIKIQNFLFDLGLSWSVGRAIHLFSHRYPCYYTLFLQHRNDQLTHSETINFYNHYKDKGEMDSKLYTIKDLKVLKMILQQGIDSPSYKPRRIERTLESKSGYIYDSIVFEVSNTEQNDAAQNEMFKQGYGWNRSNKTVRRFDRNEYPIYLFVDSNDNSITYMTTPQASGYRGIENYIRTEMNDNDKVCPKVYKYNEVIHLETIFRMGQIAPSYAPKRIVRSLDESVYYNTHGHYSTYSEIKELEENERENYPEGTFDKWKKEYGISDDDLVIWVTKNKKDVYHYLTTAENWDRMFNMSEDEMKEFLIQNDGIDISDEIYEVKDDGFIIEESDDGDGGFLFVKK